MYLQGLLALLFTVFLIAGSVLFNWFVWVWAAIFVYMIGLIIRREAT